MKWNWKKVVVGFWVVLSILIFILFYLIRSDTYFNPDGSNVLGGALYAIPYSLMNFLGLSSVSLPNIISIIVTAMYWSLVAVGSAFVIKKKKT